MKTPIRNSSNARTPAKKPQGRPRLSKEKKPAIINVKVPSEQKNRLIEIGEDYGCSFSDVIRSMIKNFLEDDRKMRKKA